ncbi:MAG TPA: DegT/DnrJ/EryC1/StrS aminotransferase family protein [Phycisphaerae bacterium]|nr:DegT/DnrJ/EryC1/StrS aminotransferase family protein [Phycisphaerae bacterium]
MSARHPSPSGAVRDRYLAFGQPDFSEEEIAAVTRVLRSGWVGMGPEVIAFEHELAAYLKVPHVVTVNSCTSALHLSLLASGVGPGDEVIVPSLTWCSTANAALYVGARPVFCDVDRDTLNLTPDLVRAKLTGRTKAVIAVHFGGLAVDMAALRRALPARVKIIEDAAHAFGSKYPRGGQVGSSGHPVCFSFYANKNLSTAEGGAIALTDDAAADRLRCLRQHALPLDAWKRFSHPKNILISNQLTELGFKMNYTDLQAAVGRVQLRRQRQFARQRRQIAAIYVKRFSQLPFRVRLQAGCTSVHHARHLFVVQLPWARLPLDREQFILAMRARNLGVTIHYAPLHNMPLYRTRQKAARLAGADEITRSIITLPMGPRVTSADAEEVMENLAALLGGRE